MTPPFSTWGRFGEDDERGMANFAGPSQVRAAAKLVRKGAVFGLDYPLNAFNPPIAQDRSVPNHRIWARHRDHRDDYLDGFFPQAGSQIDGLRHRRHAEFGFYNGFPDDTIAEGTPTLGVGRWAERPITGRGVLVDLARHHAIDHDAGEALPVSLVDSALAAQGVSLRQGDLLMIRTGWAGWYLSRPAHRRAEIRADRRFTGLTQSRELVTWFLDQRVALAASDTFALEVMPPVAGSPFGGETDNGMIHQDLIALLGLPIGELWQLDALAADCAADGTWTSLLVVKPLNLTSGVGSPANATALR